MSNRACPLCFARLSRFQLLSRSTTLLVPRVVPRSNSPVPAVSLPLSRGSLPPSSPLTSSRSAITIKPGLCGFSSLSLDLHSVPLSCFLSFPTSSCALPHLPPLFHTPTRNGPLVLLTPFRPPRILARMAVYSQFLGRRVTVRYRIGDVFPACFRHVCWRFGAVPSFSSSMSSSAANAVTSAGKSPIPTSRKSRNCPKWKSLRRCMTRRHQTPLPLPKPPRIPLPAPLLPPARPRFSRL